MPTIKLRNLGDRHFISCVVIIFISLVDVMAGNIRDNPGRIIVKNYPTNTTSRDLQIMFEKYGKIDDCRLSTINTNYMSYDCC
jgi:hypothetical protein